MFQLGGACASFLFFLLFSPSSQIFTSESKVSDCDGSKEIHVTTKLGPLNGTTMNSAKGIPLCAFLGIPFAEPPVNDLRFRAPQPATPWTYLRDATKYGSRCMQTPHIQKLDEFSEDCLYLNVYTPQLKVTYESLRAVMVYIYGGDFVIGSGQEYKPGFLLDKDIVLVTFNYRLGALGFLSTGDDECPGNFALKDQVAALEWVRDNIRNFGGDPNKVTVIGESAGAASVHYLMLSPLTKGLFHRAISMEGTVLMPWAISNNPKEHAKKQAKLVGCPTEPSSDLIECLRKVPAPAILDTQKHFFKITLLPFCEFAPVVEKQTAINTKPFISAEPIHLIINGSFQHVPWMLGANAQSGAAFISPVFNIHILTDQFKEQGEKLWKSLLLPDIANDKQDFVFNKLLEFYNVDEVKSLIKQSHEDELKLVQVVSDRYIIHGIHKAALVHSLVGHRPIYLYNFAFRGTFSTTLLSTLKNYGVAHIDEDRYFFNDIWGKYVRGLNDVEKELSEVLTTMWTNFAKYGDPTPRIPQGSQEIEMLNSLVWYPIDHVEKDNYHLLHLNIGQVESSLSMFIAKGVSPMQLNMAIDFYEDRMKFWDSMPLRHNLMCSICEKVVSGGTSKFVHVKRIIVFLILGGLYTSLVL